MDESGNTSLAVEKAGVSTHFVVSATLVEEPRVEELSKRADALRRKHFQSGEIKSSSVGSRHERRLRILRDLFTLDFKVVALAVDKREVSANGGLVYKRPFLKFLNGQLYRRLYRAFPSLTVVADEHGSREFMDGFKKYVYRKHIPDLFTSAEFEFMDSKSNSLIQVSDFVAGSIGKPLNTETPTDFATEFFETMHKNLLLLDEWPAKVERFVDRLSSKQTLASG